MSNHSWGIEVGSSAIKAINLVRRGTTVTVEDYAVMPFKRTLTAPDVDADALVQENLRKLIADHGIRHGKVIASVPGSAAFAKFAKLPPVEAKKIPDIVRFEAVQQIPFPIEEVEWDYQVLAQPDSPEVEVGIFAITKDRVNRILNNYQAAGLSIDGLTLSALAVYNAFVYDLEMGPESSGTILMDIGTSNTDVIIVEAGGVWLRTLPIGGNSFTQALVRAFKLSFAKAEKLKREANTSKYSRQIFQAMRPVFVDLIQEMQRTLGFYQSVNRQSNVTRLIGLGSSFRLPGMQKFLRQQLQIDVRRHDGFKRIDVEGKRAADFAEHAMNLVTAYGLALQGLGLERVRANILPARVVAQRAWRTKQPWFAATAAMMLAASGAAWIKLEVDKNAFNANMIQTQPRVEQTVGLAQQYVDRWRRIEGGSDPRRRIENLRRILDYRDVWPKLMYDLTLATRTLNTQPQLLATDYEAVREIPRPTRRRIYVNSISAQYVFAPPMADGLGGQGEGGAVSIDEIWADPSRRQDTNRPVRKLQPPSFVITVKGTTPHADGPKLISNHIIRWLQENSRRNDRPYQFVVTNESLRSAERITPGWADTGQRGAPQPAPAVARRRVTAGLPIEGRHSAKAQQPGWDLAELETGLASWLPVRPQSDESRVGDWSFEIQWTVQLLRPEEARHAEGPT